MTFMFLAFITLLLLIGYTSKYKPLRVVAKSIAIGLCSFVASLIGLGVACESKLLSYNFCGELTGLLRIILISGLIAISMMVTSALILWRRDVGQ